MLFEISKNLGMSSVTHILLAKEQAVKKIKRYKTLLKLRFAKINRCEKSRGSQIAKLNLREMLKKITPKNKPTRKFLSLRYYQCPLANDNI